MDIYKLQTGNYPYKEITIDNFEDDTRKQEPYYIKLSESSQNHFAICPVCDNPIQIIGLYPSITSNTKAYGRHYPKSIPNLAEYNQEAYDCCILANHKISRKDSDRKQKIKGLALEILILLMDNFDKVIYLISTETGIRINNDLAKEMLDNYLFTERAYLYTGASLLNIPYIFAYFSNAHNLFGRVLKANCELQRAIGSKIPTLGFSKYNKIIAKDENSAYIALFFCFKKHKEQVIEHKLIESMIFSVTKGKKKDSELIFEKELVFNNDYFNNLVHYDNFKRDQVLLDIAKEKIEPILLENN